MLDKNEVCLSVNFIVISLSTSSGHISLSLRDRIQICLNVNHDGDVSLLDTNQIRLFSNHY